MGLAPTLLTGRLLRSGGQGHLRGPGAVRGDGRIPGSAGSDDRVQLPQDRRGDHGLGLGDGELVLRPGGQVSEPGGIDRVGALRAPNGAPGG